jgi:hypothetical protein
MGGPQRSSPLPLVRLPTFLLHIRHHFVGLLLESSAPEHILNLISSFPQLVATSNRISGAIFERIENVGLQYDEQFLLRDGRLFDAENVA